MFKVGSTVEVIDQGPNTYIHVGERYEVLDSFMYQITIIPNGNRSGSRVSYNSNLFKLVKISQTIEEILNDLFQEYQSIPKSSPHFTGQREAFKQVFEKFGYAVVSQVIEKLEKM